MREPDLPRHPVTLGELMFDGGGVFNHLIWQVQPTLNANSVSDALASMHEWSHHELNNVSSYGLLLTYFAYLARHADDDREIFAERLRQLVKHCRVAHEVYATWYSVELLTSKFSIETLLAELPADYQAFHEQGERIVQGIVSPFLRQQVFLVVTRSCFEGSQFSLFDCDQTDRFRLTDVRTKDLPNSRLEFVINSLSEDLFSQWTNGFCEDSKEPGDAEAITVALSKKRGQSFFDLPLSEADAVLRRLLISLTTRWNHWLSERDVSNGDYEDHLKLVPLLVDSMNQRCRNVTVAHPLSATASPHDTAVVLLLQMENEVVRIRRDPLPVDVVPIGNLPRELWPSLPVGESPHLLIQVRSLEDICQQHDLTPAELGSLQSASKVLVFVRRREPPDETDREMANIFYFNSPNELKELRAVTPNVSAYGLMSSTLSVDQTWMNQWLDPSILWVIKIDHSLHEFLTQHCQNQEQVRYSTSTLHDGEQVLQFICFLTRKVDEEDWGMYIGFCSDHTAKACVQFIQQKMDPNKIVFDHEPFKGDLAPILQVIATHMIRDESFFSFNKVLYS